MEEKRPFNAVQPAHMEPQPGRRRQVIYAIIPLIGLLLCLGVINLLPDGEATGSIGTVAGTATAVPDTGSPAALATLSPNAPAPTPTPLPTPTPRPTLPPEAAITLLGPPDGSVFPAAAPLPLYWTWPYPLLEDEYFAVYLLAAGSEEQLGVLPEPNLGDGYYWQIQPADLAGLSADLAWQIRLESTLADAPLLISAARTMRLIGNP